MILFLLAFVAFLIIGIPISVSIGFSAVLGCLSLGYPLVVIGQKMVSGIDSWLLIAIPLFILAGNLMNAGKITDELFGTARELVGWIPGGLGHANVLASVIFAGMSGSASADAGGLGAIEIKAMRDHGYDDDFSAAVTAASSVIGPIFPPSIPLIIYGASASVSVSKLFMGGVIPALVMAVLMMVLIYIYAVKRGYERTAFNLRNLARQFVHALPACITPVIILAGFTLGWFTPTEASAVATIYALIISVLVYKSMDLKTFLQCLKESAISSANTLFIIGTSTLFTYVMAKEGISAEVIDPRTLVPFDYDTVAESVKKTGRLVVVHEAHQNNGWGAQVVSQVSQMVFPYLDAAPVHIGAKACPLPFNLGLEQAVLPSVKDIVDTCKASLYR